ncbi:MAG TPA: calcium-binding protein [Conexibacter sp.]|nr:calcium-binding protein [Conexibacter sp.]
MRSGDSAATLSERRFHLLGVLLAVAVVWAALGLAGRAWATQIGISDACPVAPAERHAIISDGEESVMMGTSASDLICGDSGPNLIIGGLLDDEIYGGGGADILIGGHGTDLLDGGSGSDWLRGGDGQDCYEAGVGSERTTDTVSFADATPTSEVSISGVVVDLGAADAFLEGIVPPSCALHGVESPAPGRALGQGPNEELNHIDHIIGSAFDDNVTAASGRLSISGGFGDDVLNGVGGDDSMWGDGGADACMNESLPAECIDGQGTHRYSGAYAFSENRGNGTDFGLVVLGAEGTRDDTLEVTRSSETQLRVTAGSTLGIGQNCRAVNERAVDCSLSAARYVVLWGDAGNDTLSTAGDLSNEGHGTVDINGGPGNDTLTGHSSDDNLFTGEGGADTLTGNAGSDALISEGDPVGSGGDTLNAGEGNDQIVTDNACAGHTLNGGPGWDIIGFARQTTVGGIRAGISARLGDGTTNHEAYAIDETFNQVNTAEALCAYSTITPQGEVLEGTNQKDDLWGNSGRNSIWARQGNDAMRGLGEADIIKGQEGNDTIWAGGGEDEVTGGQGNDDLGGEDGADHLYGQDGDDSTHGGEGDDVINGGAGEDGLTGDRGADAIRGSTGDDQLEGGWEEDGEGDTIWGEAGRDRLNGNAGNDTLYGGEDNDELFGEGGLDWLYGEGGADTLTANDGQPDNAVDCGSGEDIAFRDAVDLVIACER